MTMKLIVGLGNPGREYEKTRHNLGFMLIDRLMERASGRRFREEARSQVAQVELRGQRALLVKPMTFMNLSGDAVRPLVEKYGHSDARNLIVACDDAALPLGMIRVRARGSAGGQRGLQSIIDRLGSENFARVRMGIKPDHPVSDLRDFVLSPIRPIERERLEAMLDRAADAVEAMIVESVERAMSAFNERVKPEIRDQKTTEN
ncbi:MAG: aminoacyl-tRNA hydrolase [Acidobacteriota bacterium]